MQNLAKMFFFNFAPKGWSKVLFPKNMFSHFLLVKRVSQLVSCESVNPSINVNEQLIIIVQKKQEVKECCARAFTSVSSECYLTRQ